MSYYYDSCLCCAEGGVYETSAGVEAENAPVSAHSQVQWLQQPRVCTEPAQPVQSHTRTEVSQSKSAQNQFNQFCKASHL